MDRRTDGPTDRRTGDFTPSLHDATVTSAATAAAVPPLAYAPEVPFLFFALFVRRRASRAATFTLNALVE